jgi:hypothetical protein
MLLFLLSATLALLAAGVALPRTAALPPAFWAHLVLAVGVMSLITAAMQHFVPVLTRGRGAGRWMGRLPFLMLAAGLLAAAVFAGLLDFALVSPAAGLALAGALAMLVWMRRRGRAALGRPHACLDWYLAAMACLAMGLAAALAIPLLPAWHGVLRAFHVHVNLYGFVGLTAVGTLQVLMPTVADRPDPAAGPRLRSDLKWALAGALLLAVGKALAETETAAVAPWAAGAGVLAWGWVLGRLGLAWGRLYRPRLFSLHGGEPALAAALLGFAAALLASLDGVGRIDGPLTVFLPGFLFPLVTGAAGHLAPVWLRPGPALPWHADSRQRLGRFGGLRALLFLGAALLPLFGYRCAGLPGLTGLFWFLAVFAAWLWRGPDDAGRA